MSIPNTNYPWSITDGKVKAIYSFGLHESNAEDTCIIDKDGFEVVGCSEWMRGEENFERIILAVNATATLTNEQLQEMIDNQ